MYMRAHPMLLWIVPASIAMAVGTTATIMAILQYNLILEIVDTTTILLCGVYRGLLFSNQTNQKNGEDTY